MVRPIKNQKGQMIVEAILLMVIFFGVTMAVGKYFKSEEILAQLVSKPWKSLSGMLQNGVWSEPKQGGPSHPNTHIRHISLEGESAR